jgi:hypothetical protein
MLIEKDVVSWQIGPVFLENSWVSAHHISHRWGLRQEGVSVTLWFVAREYDIPAALGAGAGTKCIHNG